MSANYWFIYQIKFCSRKILITSGCHQQSIGILQAVLLPNSWRIYDKLDQSLDRHQENTNKQTKKQLNHIYVETEAGQR